jgi:hypothetical protein
MHSSQPPTQSPPGGSSMLLSTGQYAVVQCRAQAASQRCGQCAMKPPSHNLLPDTLCQFAMRIVLANIHFLLADHPRYCMLPLMVRCSSWINLDI